MRESVEEIDYVETILTDRNSELVHQLLDIVYSVDEF